MTNKLSHSAVQRYSTCGESYRQHYINKLRPTVSSANLFLGSALDTGINSLLLNDGKDPYEVFTAAWQTGFINKQPIQIKDSLQVVYGKADFDYDILSPKDLLEIDSYYKTTGLNYEHDPIDSCFTRKSQGSFVKFSEAEQRFYNFCNWTCLKRKGYLIIDAYKQEVMPRIKKVITVQKEISYDDGTGNTITGFIDFIAEMDDGNVYVLDNKSSGRRYEEGSVVNSPQLALYAHHEGLDRAGFIVFIKTIKKDKNRVCLNCQIKTDNNRIKTCAETFNGKRCGGDFNEIITPRAEIQIQLDKINPNMVKLTMENFETVNKLIQQGIFLKNLSSCLNTYGGKCPYYNKCHNNSDDGLEHV